MRITMRTALAQIRDSVAQGWTQGAFARTADANPTAADAPEATCWCLAGAIRRLDVTHAFRQRLEQKLFQLLASGASSTLGVTMELTRWNDLSGRTQEEVVALIDRALDKERRRT